VRIVIDMQGAQSSVSSQRGVGRYTCALVSAIVRNKGEHEVFLVLNGAFTESAEVISEKFSTLLARENIRIWNISGSVAWSQESNCWRRNSNELVYEAFLASLKPDVVLITSLFEGLYDDSVTSIKRFPSNYLTAVILYDLIPFIHQTPYLEDQSAKAWYLEKIELLKKGDLWFTISESSRQEGIKYLNLPSESCVNISTDADNHFQKIYITESDKLALKEKYDIKNNFVLYTGGIDHRKNIDNLIRAYALINKEVRKNFQLAIVCSVSDDSRSRLFSLAKEQGLNEGEVILTGFVAEEDLVSLYNLCSLFVFPSWHEGFGLPALEAMRCGAPVIAANTSSLPEVIGLPEALFDPYSIESIATAIEQVIIDPAFSEKLIEHSVKQTKLFSWDETSKIALKAMECHVEHSKNNKANLNLAANKPRLAYISPLPPERSGISDYSAELLPALSNYYEIEVIVIQPTISDKWIKTNCTIQSIEWFIENADSFDRVIYHFGNSPFHAHMFDLIRYYPGVVVLHDFYLSHVLSHMDTGNIIKHLYHSHGYSAVTFHAESIDESEAIWKFPCNYEVVENSLGIIVHSNSTLHLAKKWYGEFDDKWEVIPLLRSQPFQIKRSQARKILGFSDNDFIVCSFGLIGPSKLNHRLIEAWFKSDLAKNKNCFLVFVGENPGDDYGDKLNSEINKRSSHSKVRITGWLDKDTFSCYLAAADIGVQLRSLSRGETSAAALDCMNYGLGTIVNSNGTLNDLDENAVFKLADDFDQKDLVNALNSLWHDSDLRQSIGAKARNIVLEKHNPNICAEKYKNAIENFYNNNPPILNKLISSIASHSHSEPLKHELVALADSIAFSIPKKNYYKQLLIDVSEIVQRDAKTGIQRVVRALLQEWLTDSSLNGWRIEPVYASDSDTYRYARKFTTEFLDVPNNGLLDEPVEFNSGDVFLGLDLQHHVAIAQKNRLKLLSGKGIRILYVVYDLLPILHPNYFSSPAEELHQEWLKTVTSYDGVVCISKSVADELKNWLSINNPNKFKTSKVHWFHLGADVANSRPSSGILTGSDLILNQLKNNLSFLMVGTLEPRKGHADVLSAFEQLWEKSNQIYLVIVGKAGWMVESLIIRLRNHPELDRRLFWLEGISDEYLEKVYASSTCLIAASHGEGFGLPLIEAAQHNIPIIARDIPVFREVAGEHAYYFDNKDLTLAVSIQNWLNLYENFEHPLSDNLQYLTWRESAKQLLDLILPPNNLSNNLES